MAGLNIAQRESSPHRLWGGRFAGRSAAELDALNRSLSVDFRLWPYDVRISKAWAMALWNAGVLSLDESREIEEGLERVAARLEREAGSLPLPADEDVHTLIDRLLHEEIGETASKLHTGRSRNDQVATATRLWAIEACGQLDVAIAMLQRVLLDKAASLSDALMPAYTHLQRAQPVYAAHWMLSHFWPLDRDRTRLAAAARSASTLPLGSGAIAGSAYPVSRVLLQGSLGFSAISANSLDAVGDRDFVVELLFVATLLATHVSRLAEDLIVYGSSEFGFVRFGETFTTGSSMMPQKRNPDALELGRGSAARTLGDFVSVVGTLKGLPSGYSKDLQDDKRPLFDALDTALLVIPAVSGTLDEIQFDTDAMRRAITETMMATDVADWLVQTGLPFRKAHEIVGAVVREAESRACALSALDEAYLGSVHPLLPRAIATALDPINSVAQRDVPGGTGPSALRAQIAAAESRLNRRKTPRGNELQLRADI